MLLAKLSLKIKNAQDPAAASKGTESTALPMVLAEPSGDSSTLSGLVLNCTVWLLSRLFPPISDWLTLLNSR